MNSLGLSEYVIGSTDTLVFDGTMSKMIVAHFRVAGFFAQDIGHHIVTGCYFDSPDKEPMECACIYLEDEHLWVKAIAARWWFRDTNDDQYFNSFWAVIDLLKQSQFKPFIAANKFHEGVVGGLPSPDYCDEGFKEAFESGLLKDWFGVPSDYEQLTLF